MRISSRHEALDARLRGRNYRGPKAIDPL